ncbi:hypothetical protein [Spiroplasma ixodetis]|nr:hypothetical protein [Spiroplasma ixodetis]
MNKTLIVGIYQKTTNNLIVKVLKNAKSKNRGFLIICVSLFYKVTNLD